MTAPHIPSDILDILEGCVSWNQVDGMRFTSDWKALESVGEFATQQSGIYILGLPSGVKYDKSQSRVIYIGSTHNLKERLTRHAAQPHNRVIEQIQKTFPGGLWVTAWLIPRLPKDWLLRFEAAALWSFYRDFGTVPVANLDIPKLEWGEEYEHMVCIEPCLDLVKPFGLDELAERMGCVCVRETFMPRGNAEELGVEIGLATTENGLEFLKTRSYKTGRFYPPEVLEKQKDETTRVVFFNDYIATWSVEKMRQIVNISRILSLLETKTINKKLGRKKYVYDAPEELVIHPHTWGEVAAIQCRMKIGTWFAKPDKREWIQVVRDDRILAECRLNSPFSYGGLRVEDYSCPKEESYSLPSYFDKYEDEEDEYWDRLDDGIPDPSDAEGYIRVEGDMSWFELKEGVDNARDAEMREAIETAFQRAIS